MAQRTLAGRRSVKSPKKIKKDYRLWIYLFPCLVLVIAFGYVPIAGWVLAFLDYIPGISIQDSPFVGLKYFRLIFSDYSNMLRVMKNTVMFALLGYLVAPLSMIFAIALSEVRGSGLRRAIQTITTFPNFISWVIVYALAFQFFSYDGMLSNLLMSLGLTEDPTSLLANKDAVYLFQTCMGLWKGLGWSAVIYLAAIAGIDQEEFEAAAIDGAGRWRQLWHITLSGIRLTIITLFIIRVGDIMYAGFDQIYAMSNDAVIAVADIIDTYVYRLGLTQRNFSLATAAGLFQSAIGLVLVVITNYISKKIDPDSGIF